MVIGYNKLIAEVKTVILYVHEITEMLSNKAKQYNIYINIPILSTTLNGWLLPNIKYKSTLYPVIIIISFSVTNSNPTKTR